MKTLRIIAIALCLCAPALAWNCTAPGQVRVQVPNGTKGTGTGDGPGEVVVDNGLTFECETLPTSTPSTTNNNTNNNSNSNTNNNVAKSTVKVSNTLTNQQSQTQLQNQSQNQTATGGNASSNATATGNGDNSNNSVTNYEAPKIPVNSAIAPPVLPTAPCTKGFGGAGQGMLLGGSFGMSRVDQGCDDRELARAFSGPQTVASCKILLSTKKAKKAGITMADCLQVRTPVPPAPVVIREMVPAPPVALPQPIVIIVPTPVPAPPQYKTEVTVHAPRAAVRKHATHLPPNCQNVVQKVCKQ